MQEPGKKPIIFVFSTAYHPFIGGAEVAIEQVAKRLKNEFDFVIFTSWMRRDLPKREARDDGLVVRLGLGNKFLGDGLVVWFFDRRNFENVLSSGSFGFYNSIWLRRRAYCAWTIWFYEFGVSFDSFASRLCYGDFQLFDETVQSIRIYC